MACRELAGDETGALAEYRAMGALYDVRRLSFGAVAAAPENERALLSQREMQIARLVCDGESNKAIASVRC